MIQGGQCVGKNKTSKENLQYDMRTEEIQRQDEGGRTDGSDRLQDHTKGFLIKEACF